MIEQISTDYFHSLTSIPEGEVLEFKEAKQSFSMTTLADYSAAISNEGGGKLILGVKNNGNLVGTSIYSGTENKVAHQLYQLIGIKTHVTSYHVGEKRIVVVEIPSRPMGRPVVSSGKYRYPMRLGESLVEMDMNTLSQIFNEISPDHSAMTITGSSISDLESSNIAKFKNLWAKKTSNSAYLKKPDSEILSSLNLISVSGLTLSGLLLFGSEESLAKFVPDAEIVFEWRSEPDQTNYDYRQSWRSGFLGIYEDIWKVLDARNVRHSFQEGLIQREIKSFDEKPFREALLNAIAHRDYRMSGHSIFIKANPKFYTVESPGGLIGGVNLKNIFHKTAWRNRLLAESLEKAGLVERSGQGIDDIFEISIRNGKGAPIMEEPFSNSFKITIPARIQDEKFIRFLESISQDKGIVFSLDEIIELERIRKEAPVQKIKFKEKFLEYGLVEKIGRSRGTKYVLSHDYYQVSESRGVYTRLTGISRSKRKALIIQHIEKNNSGKRADFLDAFPELSPKDITNLLQELKGEGKITFVGHPKYGTWKLNLN